MFSKIKKNICSNCNYENPILLKKCNKCKNFIINKNNNLLQQETDEEKKIMSSRINTLSYISSNINKIINGLNILNPEILAHESDRKRFIYLLICMTKDNDQDATILLNKLIELNIENVENNQDEEITKLFQEMIPKMEIYENIHFTFNADIEREIEHYSFNRQQITNHNIDYDHYNNMSDTDSDYYSDDYSYDAYNEAATKEQLLLIKLIEYKNIPDNLICVICQEDFSEMKDNKEIIILPCGHVFHNECILKWLEQKNTCPLGRCKIESLEDLLK